MSAKQPPKYTGLPLTRAVLQHMHNPDLSVLDPKKYQHDVPDDAEAEGEEEGDAVETEHCRGSSSCSPRS